MRYAISALNKDASVLKEGYLLKKSRWMGRWRKRWTVLMSEPNTKLCYLATYSPRNRKSYTAPTELVVLSPKNKTEAMVVAADEALAPNAFGVRVNAKRFIFRAKSEKARNKWLAMLRRNTATNRNGIQLDVIRETAEEEEAEEPAKRED